MTRRAPPVVLAVFLAACNSPPPPESIENTAGAASIHSYLSSEPAKQAKSFVLSWGENSQPEQLAIADLVTYKSDKATITAPAGWTLIQDNGNPLLRQSLYWHIVATNEPHAYTWTFSQPVDAQGTMLLVDDAAPQSPVDASSGNSRGDMVAKSVKTTSDGELILAFYADNFGGAGFTAPDYMGEIAHEETELGGYAILGTYQRHKGDTGDAACIPVQAFVAVAAQVAIRRAGKAAQAP